MENYNTGNRFSYEAALKQLNLPPGTVSIPADPLPPATAITEQQTLVADVAAVDTKLQALSSKRLQTLEHIIEQKNGQISQLQSDVAVAHENAQSEQ